MRGTNVLFGQIVVVFGIVIIGVWSATQWAAAALGYQARLGAPWFDLSGTPVYYPWKLFEWWFVFDAYARRHDCGRQWFCGGRGCHRHVGMARTAITSGDNLWFCTLGKSG